MPNAIRAAVDLKALAAGISTTGVGVTVSTGQVEATLGIVASVCGITLTIATFVWRWQEDRRTKRFFEKWERERLEVWRQAKAEAERIVREEQGDE